ncbi:MAG: hypothetical protein F4Z40_09795 [Chloroflexi bacterium]|nr:hypothetical protein [Chloroflexota bacterium]
MPKIPIILFAVCALALTAAESSCDFETDPTPDPSAPRGGNPQSVPAEPPEEVSPSKPSASTQCMIAFQTAASVSDLRDQHSDLWPAFQACMNLDEWVAASEAHPDALDGADPIRYAFNQCASESAVGGSNVCKAIAQFEQPDDFGFLGSRLLGYQAESAITATGGIGVSVRYACALDARDRDGAAWPEGQAVEVFAVGVEECAGWSLARGPDGQLSWVSDQYLKPFERTLERVSAPLPASLPVVYDIEDCFSLWDGNLDALEGLVRPLLNDEGSMETHETLFSRVPDSDGWHAVRMTFSAENAFGGRVKYIANGRVRPPDDVEPNSLNCPVMLDGIVDF